MRNVLGEALLSPLERIAKWVSPRSMPTRPCAFGFGVAASSHSSEAKYRPAASREIVTVVSLAAFAMVRDQRMESASSILAQV